VRVAFAIGFLMVDAVRRDPEDRTALERQGAADGQEVLHPERRLVAAMRQEAVVRHADAEHAGDEIEDDSGNDRAWRDEEKGGDGGHMKMRVMATVVITFMPCWCLRPYMSDGIVIEKLSFG